MTIFEVVYWLANEVTDIFVTQQLVTFIQYLTGRNALLTQSSLQWETPGKEAPLPTHHKSQEY